MNAITVVSQLIAEAHLRFGSVDSLEVPESLWEQAMDAVADAGGQVGLDHCVVDGVSVRMAAEPLAEDVQAIVHPGEGHEAHPLTLGDSP